VTVVLTSRTSSPPAAIALLLGYLAAFVLIVRYALPRDLTCATTPDTLFAKREPTTEGAPMPSPRTPQDLEPEDGSGAQPRHDQAPAEPTPANPVTRIQTRTGGYIARHPALSRVLEWLGWNNPGASTNP